MRKNLVCDHLSDQATLMNICVIGAGVNGVCVAIKFAEAGHNVSVFEKGKAFSETSSKSSRMFHGGIRYLEQGHCKLVREALEACA